MPRTRENNYDLLRIVCAIAVIAIHASAAYLGAYNDPEIFDAFYREHLVSTNLWNVLSRFAVPCFMMLSGAFLLSDERNMDYRAFYRRSFRKLGVPALVFTALYFVYEVMLAAVSVLFKGRGMERMLSPVVALLRGDTGGHLWYLYATAGVYLLVPFLLRLKKEIGENAFAKITWVFLTLASIGYVTSRSALRWDVGFQFRFTAYFMAGYALRRLAAGRKNNARGMLLVLGGGGIELLVARVQFAHVAAGIAEADEAFPVVGPLCPWIVAASLLVFAGFSLLDVRRDFSRLAADTFYIYLFHNGVLSVIHRAEKYLIGPSDSRLMIPANIAVVFAVSLVLSRLWNGPLKGLARRRAEKKPQRLRRRA